MLVLYDANNTKSKMFKRIKKTHVQSILVLHIYSGENHIPGTMVCEQLLFFLLCSPGKKKKKKIKSQVAVWCTETDGQPLRSYFLRDNRHALLA